MATSFTEMIRQDKVKDLKDFAMVCARSFGACYYIREEELSTSKPILKMESDFNNDIIKELADFLNLNESEKIKWFHDEKEKNILYFTKEIEQRKVFKEKLEKMLKDVEEWNPPTKEHYGLKDFMVRQIKDAILLDCDPSYFENAIKSLEEADYLKWEKNKIVSLTENVKYNIEDFEKRKRDIQKGQEWIDQLYNSFFR